MILDFTGLTLNEDGPIYMQIIRYIKMSIASGDVSAGDEMPSRRLLSATLNVNPNTIQKAYKQIEQEGLLVSYAGSKSVLQFDDTTVQNIRHELIAGEATHFIASLKQIGMSKMEAAALLNTMWDKKENHND